MVKSMKYDLEALDLWETVEEDYEVFELSTNPTMAKVKNHKDRKTWKEKDKAYLFSAVSTIIFARIMNLKSTKEIWDYLKSEHQDNERIKGIRALNCT